MYLKSGLHTTKDRIQIQINFYDLNSFIRKPSILESIHLALLCIENSLKF